MPYLQKKPTTYEVLMSHGVSRRTFLDSCKRRTALIGLVTQPRVPVIPRASHPIVSDHKPVVNVPGCSPIADVMAGVKEWRDEVAKMGCRGPVTHSRCSDTNWNGGTSWPVDSGHPRTGCAEKGFRDYGPLHRKLAGVRTGRHERGERRAIHTG